MVGNKLDHTILGLAVCAVGIAGYRSGWFPRPASLLFLALALAGVWWAGVIGHAWLVLPGLLLIAPSWLFERIDPRPPARLRRRAQREGVGVVSMADLASHAAEYGRHFRYRIEQGGVLRVTDLGECERWAGRRVADVFGVGRREALVIDYREDDPAWRHLAQQPWMQG